MKTPTPAFVEAAQLLARHIELSPCTCSHVWHKAQRKKSRMCRRCQVLVIWYVASGTMPRDPTPYPTGVAAELHPAPVPAPPVAALAAETPSLAAAMAAAEQEARLIPGAYQNPPTTGG